ncbi:ABC transporter ATP-binding/permease protein [Pseudomonas savastanoi pv. phaseolicola]|nr:ABC transporter ATP-binding/permease protein [Pseudomonas savastanoi pv. phaseolicola]KPB48177.1 ABC transporter ATP-binding/permease protein [Pseudomonas savastanoi pv. phaseolicola]KPB67540.1 ABC transporter ATP-binding/permease protein [Pseudomonas savastanoi pv. phaseolicola]KPB72411.1 ABC transporter ATP-binding/permease protein [Pseudomonas amygdali pv. mellea]
MLRAFEKWLDPFPPDEVPPPPDGLVRFLWACTRGARGYILALALLSAGVSIYEAWLFSFLGQVGPAVGVEGRRRDGHAGK